MQPGPFSPGPLELLIVGFLCLAFVVVPVVIVAVVLLTRTKGSPPAGQEQRVRCPECGESIAVQAVKCRFCGARFDRPPSGSAKSDKPEQSEQEGK
jgi:ribosomal protein S27E